MTSSSPTPADTDSLLQSIRTYSLFIRGMKKHELYFEDIYGDTLKDIQNFRQAAPKISHLQSLTDTLASISGEDFLFLPLDSLTRLDTTLHDTASVFQEISKFYKANNNPAWDEIQHLPDAQQKEKRENIIKQLTHEKEKITSKLDELHSSLFEITSPLLTWLTSKKTEAYRKELQTQLNALKVEDTIAKHSEIFDGYAHEHDCAASGWLATGLMILGITIAFSHFYSYPDIQKLIDNKAEFGYVACITILNLFVIGLLGSSSFWAFKNYKLNKHNELLNRTKSTTLKTFNNFLDATKDEKTAHEVILLKMSDAIFNSNEFGYLKEESTGQHVSSSELMNAIIQLAKKGV